jgi:protease-4
MLNFRSLLHSNFLSKSDTTKPYLMRLRYIIAMIAALMLTPEIGRAQGVGGILRTTPSIAEPDGIAAVLDNVAGVGVLNAWELRIYNTQAERGGGEGTALLWGAPVFGPLSVGTGIEMMRPSGSTPNYGRISLVTSLRINRKLFLGLAWRYFLGSSKSAVNGVDSMDVGLLYRPARFVSLGFTALALNGPEVSGQTQSRRYGFGVGFHPGTDRVSIDLGAEIDEESGDVDITTRLRVAPMDGIEVGAFSSLQPRGDDLGFTIGASLGFSFGPAGVEGGVVVSSPVDGDLALSAYSFGARASGAKYPPIYRRTGKTVSLTLSGFPETPRPTLTSGGRATFTHIAHYLSRLAVDDTVSGVLIRDRRSSGGWAQAEEIGTLILRLRKAGKKITVHLDHGTLKHLYMYAHANTIMLNPAGGLNITGLRTTLSYYKDVLTKIGVDTQWVKHGRFKTFPEQFSRTNASPASKEVKNSLLDALYSAILKRIGAGRKLSAAKVKAVIDDGPFVAPEALKAGLVDKLAFWDEVSDLLKKANGGVLSLVPASAGMPSAPRPWGRGPAVAVIPVEGQSVEGKSRRMSLLGSKMVGSDTIVAALGQAAANPRVIGIVLRVNSPGGSSMASDLIQRKVAKVAKHKPVIVSFGNVAASGGYYAAMGATKVMSSDSTVTGSIGIFTGKPAFGRLQKWLGVGRETFTRGKQADLFSQDRPWNTGELKLIAQKLKFFYDEFLKRVAEGRKLTVKQVDKVAQGRVWLGVQARANKLVDERGGVADAVHRLKVMAGLSARDRVSLMFLPRASFTQRIRAMLGVEIAALLKNTAGLKQALELVYPFLAGYRAGEPLALMPFHLEIE